jgi:hypothetical protein
MPTVPSRVVLYAATRNGSEGKSSLQGYIKRWGFRSQTIHQHHCHSWKLVSSFRSAPSVSDVLPVPGHSFFHWLLTVTLRSRTSIKHISLKPPRWSATYIFQCLKNWRHFPCPSQPVSHFAVVVTRPSASPLYLRHHTSHAQRWPRLTPRFQHCGGARMFLLWLHRGVTGWVDTY